MFRKERADYVIVGIGTAGAVLAKELSDNRETSVIGLHNGPNLSDDPLIALSKNAVITTSARALGPPLYQTRPTTEQPKSNCITEDWAVALPLGGASEVNVGFYSRATQELFATWEKLAGPEWSPERLLEVYKRLETYNGDTPNPETRGFKGPLSVRQNSQPSEVGIKFAQAISVATNTPIIEDFNDPFTPIGTSFKAQYTQSGCTGDFRASSASAFLNERVMTRQGVGVHGRKLLVKFNTVAQRLLWKGNKAIGVEYCECGKLKRVYAKQGVIVTAGLFSSALLMRSGVGSRKMLDSLGIPVVFDNPNVGQFLTDQPNIRIFFESNPLDAPINTDFFTFPNNSPIGCISYLPAPGGDPTNRELRIASLTAIPGFSMLLFDLVQAKSRGSITLASADPSVPPVINPGLFTNPDDLNLFIQGFQVYIKGINEAFQEIDPLYELVVPSEEIIDDTELLTQYIKDEIETVQHWQSHCRMAPFDQQGVVDDHGRVYGVENLFVADNSIVPEGMDGTPMSSAYLIAANIARLLKR